MRQLANVFGVIGGGDAILHHVTAGIEKAQLAVVELQAALIVHQPHEQGRRIGEGADLLAEALHPGLEPIERAPRDGERLRHASQNAIAVGGGERFVDAAGHHP